jgi:hypothetical protein
MPSSYTFDLPVTRDQLEAIGMVVVEWSYLESMVDAAIWTVAAVFNQDFGEAITAHIPILGRLSILATLYRLDREHSHAPADDRDQQLSEFQTILGRIEPLQRKRNKLVHGRWVRGDQGSPMMYLVQARGHLRRERLGWNSGEIRQVAADIAVQSEALRALFHIESSHYDPE